MRRRAIFALALTIFLDFVGFGMILPVMPYFAEHLGASATAVAWLSTLFSLTQLVLAPILGRLSDRVGRRPVILLSIAGSVATSLMIGWAESLWVLMLARVLSGASKANLSAAQAAVADLVEPHARARYMGIIGAAVGMGFVFGPGLGGFLSTQGMPTLPFFVAAGLSVINGAFVMAWLPETRPLRAAGAVMPARRHWGLGEVAPAQVSAFRRLLVACMLFFVAFALMESTFALFNARIFGWGARQTGLFLTYIGVVLALVQGGLVGRLAKRIGEVRSLQLGIVVTGVGMALAALTSVAQPLLGWDVGDATRGATALGLFFYSIAGMGMAAGNALCMATTSALVSMLSPPGHQGGNLGVRESAAALGRIIGPAMAGPLFDMWSPAAPLWAAAGFCALNLMVVFDLVRSLGASTPVASPS